MSDEKTSFKELSNGNENQGQISDERNLEKKLNNSKNRYLGIDLIRVLSCYFVIQIHASELYYIGQDYKAKKGDQTFWAGIYSALSKTSVPSFIMISGYLLLPLKSDLYSFLKRRFTRVVIPFLIFCVLYDILFYFLGKITFSDLFINIPKIFINFGTEIGHLWYIYMIFGIYLFMPIVSPFVKTATFDYFIYYFILWGISLFTLYIRLYYKEIWGEAYWNNTSTLQSFIGNFGYSILGVFIKLHLKNYDLKIIGLILFIIGTSITMGGYLYQRTKAITCEELEISWNYNTINVGIASFGWFLIFRKFNCKKGVINNILSEIALKSYGIFLIHIFFLIYYNYLLDGENRNPIWCIPVLTIFTFISSYLSVKFISYLPYNQYIIG